MFENVLDEALLERRRKELLGQKEAGYADIQKQLAEQEALINQQAGSQRQATQSRLQEAQALAEQQALAGQRSARGTYADLMTESRRQARAMGGGGGSGIMELYNKLDQQLAQQLYGVGTQRASTINAAQATANQALTDLDMRLQEQINAINADRRKSLREKEAAIQDIEFAATNQAGIIKRWQEEQRKAEEAARAASRASGGGGYYGDVFGSTATQEPIAAAAPVKDFTIETTTPVQVAKKVVEAARPVKTAPNTVNAIRVIKQAEASGSPDALWRALNEQQDIIGRNNSIITDGWKRWNDLVNRQKKPLVSKNVTNLPIRGVTF